MARLSIFLVAAIAAVAAVSAMPIPHLPKSANLSYVAEHSMGSFDLRSAPPCGTPMASILGVEALSNGGDQGTGNCCGGDVKTGCAYQCVELAQRFMHVRHGVIPDWGVPYAKLLCSEHPSTIKHTKNPGNGDLIVFSFGTYGHVAVIDSITSSDVKVVEQNASPTGRSTYPRSEAECFLTAA